MSDHSNYEKEITSEDLLNLIATYFDLDELQTLCFKLGIDYENLKGAGKVGKVRELVLYTSRNNRLNELLTIIKNERPFVNWPKNAVIFPFDNGSAVNFIPPPHYQRFIGRDDDLEIIQGHLRNPKKSPIIAIIGLGGMGKTALARKIVEDATREKIFNNIVWISFQTEHFTSETIYSTESRDFDFHVLLDEISRQCLIPNLSQLSLEEKEAVLKAHMTTEMTLIVLDNLEAITANDGDQLIARLFQILGKSTLLVTSRRQIKHEQAFLHNLRGLDQDDAILFIREDSRDRGISVVKNASRENLLEIVQVTGGHPLAMKLVIGQMSRQPMRVVLEILKQAVFDNQDEKFYRFLYKNSWDMLEENARMALVDLAEFPPISGGMVKDVQEVSQMSDDSFWLAMDQLVTLSLVDMIGSIGQERFALHPLTQYFVRSDITGEWS